MYTNTHYPRVIHVPKIVIKNFIIIIIINHHQSSIIINHQSSSSSSSPYHPSSGNLKCAVVQQMNKTNDA